MADRLGPPSRPPRGGDRSGPLAADPRRPIVRGGEPACVHLSPLERRWGRGRRRPNSWGSRAAAAPSFRSLRHRASAPSRAGSLRHPAFAHRQSRRGPRPPSPPPQRRPKTYGSAILFVKSYQHTPPQGCTCPSPGPNPTVILTPNNTLAGSFGGPPLTSFAETATFGGLPLRGWNNTFWGF